MLHKISHRNGMIWWELASANCVKACSVTLFYYVDCIYLNRSRLRIDAGPVQKPGVYQALKSINARS